VTGDLEKRRKRLRFQCWHRGTKELDLLLGGFADQSLSSLSAEQLGRLERLLEVPEPLLYDWIVGRTEPLPDFDHDVMGMLRNFKLKR
jgi:antitoxin CptB